MVVKLNGVACDLPDRTTAEGLLDLKKFSRSYMAFELNGEIVPKRRFSETVLKDGDSVEVIHLVGGG